MTFITNTINQKSILILGATGRTGLECVRALAQHPTKPKIHAFCRDPSKLPVIDQKLCTFTVQGNARSKQDLERALRETEANIVLVSVGGGDSVAKSDIRTASAQALASVLLQPEFDHVRALIISSNGAGGSRIKVGLGIGRLIEYHLKYVLQDHNGQEDAFCSSPNLLSRTCIVRPTSLTDNAPNDKIVAFGDHDKPKTIKIDRSDVAGWITKAICDESVPGGKIVNITGVKM